MIMKIDAIVREEKFEDVKNALMEIEVNGLTVSQVMGCGLQRGYKEIVRGMEVEPQMQPKIKFEIVVSSEEWAEKTIEAIKKELIASGKIDKNLYDWGVFNISIKRANMAQRHRFVESLKKLREYCDTNDVYWTSIPDVARITGRNVKTIRDWINKGFIPVARIGYISPSTYIVLEEAIKSLSGLIYNSKLKKN